MDLQRLKEIFEKEGAYTIIVGQNYTVDEMGSALALYLSLSSQGRDISIISQKPTLVEVSNLVGIDRVRQNYESRNGDLVVSFPYQEDEIGKVSYTLESGFLNIIVKPKDKALSFGEKDVLFRRSGEAPRVLIAVGVSRMSDITSMFNVESLKETTIVNIDKGNENEGFGDVVIIGEGASSVSEQIANILLTLGYPLDPDISQNLFSGLMVATSNFQNPRTSSLAFEMAGVLLRSGAVRQSLRVEPKVTSSLPQQQPFRMPQMPRQNQGIRPAAFPTRPFPSLNQMPQMPKRDLSKEQKKDDQPEDQQDTPPDWLAPKIFKGSTNVE